MDVLHDRCAAVDVSKKDVKVALRTPGTRRNQRHTEVPTFATTTNALLEMQDWLVAERVSLVVMEATSDYWRAPYYLLEEVLNVELINAKQAKAMPGRKSDVADSVWLAQLAECGLLRASFVPPEPIRHLRDLTRFRSVLADERVREAARLEKELEDAGIKLSVVVSDILGVSARAMLEALIRGERDPQVLAELARGRMRPKIPDLMEAMIGRFGEHHAFLCRLHLNRIDQLERDMAKLSTRIEEVMAPFHDAPNQLATIPGVSQRVAEVIIAETGGDMSRFPTAAHLASWAGVCPGNHESGGRRKSGKTRKGNRWLRDALGPRIGHPDVAILQRDGRAQPTCHGRTRTCRSRVPWWLRAASSQGPAGRIPNGVIIRSRMARTGLTLSNEERAKFVFGLAHLPRLDGRAVRDQACILHASRAPTW